LGDGAGDISGGSGASVLLLGIYPLTTVAEMTQEEEQKNRTPSGMCSV
jgi:hypothetical protein